jgi:hypothetical protein
MECKGASHSLSKRESSPRKMGISVVLEKYYAAPWVHESHKDIPE